MKIEIKDDGELVRVLKEIKEGLSQLAEAVSSRDDKVVNSRANQTARQAEERRDRTAPGAVKMLQENHEADRTVPAAENGEEGQAAEVSKESKGKNLVPATMTEAEKANLSAEAGRLDKSSMKVASSLAREAGSMDGEGWKGEGVEEHPSQQRDEEQSESNYTIQEVRAVLAQMSYQEAKKLLGSYGVTKLKELAEIHYGSLMRKAGERLC